MSKAAIEGLKPAAVWEQFYEISQIPRESGNEEGVRNYVLKFAKENEIESRVDSAGNVVLKKGAAPGYDHLPVAILQGHLDMVCEKNRGTDHDFAKDPINIKRDADWVFADGTTLGADNGIALAMAMAVMADNSIVHGPLEVLFTVDEETGLNGAMGFDSELLDGKILINLDSEEEDALYIGCAGGVNTKGKLPVKWETVPSGWTSYSFGVLGLTGGHSGGDIHKNLGNALQMAAAVVTGLRQLGAKLATFNGGGKHNAIPRETFADLLIPPGMESKAEALVKVAAEGFKAEWSDIEPGLTFEFAKGESFKEVLKDESFQTIMDLLFAMPHGVIGMSRKMESLVETSTNMAAAELKKDGFYLLTSQRSSSNFLRDNAAEKVMACIRAAGGEPTQTSLYPGWNPDPSSPLLAVSKKAYKNAMGKEAHIKAIHAGLECGVIGAKIPGIDMISFGPDLEMVHTPQERMRISSVAKIWTLFREILANLK